MIRVRRVQETFAVYVSACLESTLQLKRIGKTALRRAPKRTDYWLIATQRTRHGPAPRHSETCTHASVTHRKASGGPPERRRQYVKGLANYGPRRWPPALQARRRCSLQGVRPPGMDQFKRAPFERGNMSGHFKRFFAATAQHLDVEPPASPVAPSTGVARQSSSPSPSNRSRGVRARGFP